jgi:ribonuclease Z
MDLIILGSSAAIPTLERNLSSVAIRFRSETILFDAGEDLQRRLIQANLKFNKPLRIFISHFHGDHIIGLPGLLFRFSLINRDAPLTITGKKNLFLYLCLHRKILGLHAEYPLTVQEIDPEQNNLLIYEGLDSQSPVKEIEIKDNIIFETNRYKVKYTKVAHSVESFAYAFVENLRYGKFHPERAKELGIPQGPLWGVLQSGETISHKGKKIDPLAEGIVDPKRPGRKITYSGDTMPCKSLIELGKDSDILIHEASFRKDLQDIATEKNHSTSVDAAGDAKKMNAEKLILTHISSRYQEDAEKLLKEAQEIFPNTILAKDLMKLKIKKD